ncbi:MAG: tripartite tricarboxylate transporter substrate binding protein [Burkholderiales bacterium]
MRKLMWMGGLAAPVLCMAMAAAQSYPNRPVRIIVPYAAGGGTDLNARPVAQKLTERWGQSVVVENRSGGNAMIGTDAVAKAPPDGYTILFHASSEIVTNVSLFKKVPYDPVRDFAPVTLASTTPVIIVTHPSVPVKTIKQLIALAKARPAALSYASVGTASPQHLAGEMLKAAVHISMEHIPFKGAAPALIDVLGGHVPVGFIALLPTVPHVNSGRLTALAVTTAKRSGALPAVPTMMEAGFREFELAQWYGVLVPAATPKEIVAKLTADFVWALTLPEVKDRFTKDGCDVVASSAEQLAAYIKTEISKNARIIKAANVRVE